MLGVVAASLAAHHGKARQDTQYTQSETCHRTTICHVMQTTVIEAGTHRHGELNACLHPPTIQHLMARHPLLQGIACGSKAST